MNLMPRIFWTDEAFQAAVEAKADEIVRLRIAARIRLYSENPMLLRAFVGGYWGLAREHVPEQAATFANVSRGLRAFGDELAAVDPTEPWRGSEQDFAHDEQLTRAVADAVEQTEAAA